MRKHDRRTGQASAPNAASDAIAQPTRWADFFIQGRCQSTRKQLKLNPASASTTSSFKDKCRSLITFAGIGITLAGCSVDDNKNSVSDDVGALKIIVQIPAETTMVRWEIFGTPEYTGGVPGPTDYMTLIAELNLDEKLWTALPKEGPTDIYIVPEAARPWLSNDFRLLLGRSKNANLPISKTKNCKPYTTRLTKTGRQVSGFICKGADRLLLYVMVLSRSLG